MDIIVLFLLLAIPVYLFKRNDNVYKFREYLLDIIYKDYINNEHYLNKKLDIYYKYSYHRMLLSIKPLKLEVWYSEEEIKILKGEEL